MYRSLQLIVLLFLLFIVKGFSQTGPGGVGNMSSQMLWLKPDAFVLTDGQSVPVWSDDSGNGHDLSQPLVGFQPILKENIVNGYDAVRFNVGNRRLVRTGFTMFPTTEVTAFYVDKSTDNNDGVLSYASSAHDNDFLMYNSNNLNYYRGPSNTGMTIDANDNNWHIVDVSWKSAGGNLSTYLDGNNQRNTTFRSGVPITAGGSLSLAGEQDGINTAYVDAQAHQGDMAEVIVFNTFITSVERVIVQNYLSAKYDLALGTNDLYTQDNTLNGDFDHNVAGIGQATDGSTHTDSKGTGIVRMYTPSSISNNDYLFWGEEVRQSNYSFVTDPLNYNEHLDSKWRVTKLNDLGTVTVSFDLSSVDLSGRVSCHPLQLIVDTNSNFSTGVSYDLTIVGTTATVTNVSFADGDYFTLRYLDQIVWDGTTFYNGSGLGNAPNTLDSCLKLTVKSGANAVLTVNAHVRNIEIETGATLKIADGILLEAENEVVLDGVLELEGEAQLIQNDTGTSTNSGSGELIITQQGTLNLYNYNYWSAPVNRGGFWKIKYLEEPSGVLNFAFQNDSNPATIPLTLSSKWLYGFNATQGNYYGWNYLGTEADIAPGIGYTMKGSGSTSIPMFTEENYIFKGIPNNGDYTYAVTSGNNFLIGNPYPSGLNATQFITDNLSVIDGTLYFWEQFNTNNTHVTASYQGGYATLNLMMGLSAVAAPPINGGTTSKGAPVASIPVGQGFFVNVNAGGNLVFNNAQRVFAKESLAESTFFKTSQQNTGTTTSNITDNRIKYWLTFSDEIGRVREIGLGYDTNASINYDNGYDAEDYNNLPDNMLWTIPNFKLAIQALQAYSIEDEMPLTLNIETPGLYTVGLKGTLNFPEAVGIYLKDNLNEVYYNLKTADATLFFDSGENDTRYSIVYEEANTLGTDANTLASGFLVSYNNEFNQLVINNAQQIETIKSLNIYNLLGQEVIALEHLDSNTITLPNVVSGVYVIEVVGNDKSRFTHKFVID